MTPVHAAFGLTIRSDVDLPWPPTREPDERRRVEISLVDTDTLVETWSGTDIGPTWDTTFPGGRRVTVERGRDGSQLFRHAERDYFLLSPAADRIACLPRDLGDPSWRRFLLDTVLWWTALANGLQALHAGAVELDGGVVAILSASGGGKSTLTGELLLRGARLFSDDVLVIGPAPDLTAHPGPPLMNIATERSELHALGTTLARLDEGDEELWTAVEGAATRSQPLRAMFVYARGPGRALAVERMRPTVLELMPHAWGLPDDAEAARERFALLADLAQRIPVHLLSAGPSDAPAAIAATVTGALS